VWDFHDRMSGVKSFLILCGSVFIRLSFVVIQNATNSTFIPAGWKRCFGHDRLPILRRPFQDPLVVRLDVEAQAQLVVEV
jgi:hypothetical protein